MQISEFNFEKSFSPFFEHFTQYLYFFIFSEKFGRPTLELFNQLQKIFKIILGKFFYNFSDILFSTLFFKSQKTLNILFRILFYCLRKIWSDFEDFQPITKNI